MIRRAVDGDFDRIADNECLVRILGLRIAYGPDAAFVQYFSDDDGGLMSLMDGVAVIHLVDLTDEWTVFLAMNPDVQVIHCSDMVGARLCATGMWNGGVGDVMEYKGPACADSADVEHAPSLPAVHKLLEQHFPSVSPLNSWYPDVSHRIRHGNGHISAVLRDGNVVSTAMTVVETPTAAILGQIATHPDFRRQGMAATCIKSTISLCKAEKLYILPLNENARRLYENLGFVACGGWAELQRTN